MTAQRWLAFGDLDGARWGAASVSRETGRGHAVLGAGDEAEVVEVELDAAGDGWRLRGEGLELTISPVRGDAGPASGSPGEGFGELERATGSFTLEGTERSVDAPAWRLALADPGDVDSLRLLAAWFDGGEALALMALRPRRARGQEGDRIMTALLESGSLREVTDPRLSTTYTGEGLPFRAGVELWVSEPSEDPDAVRERPHRVAGQATGAGAGWDEGSLELRAQPFRWHSHGRDGAGVYVLGRAG